MCALNCFPYVPSILQFTEKFHRRVHGFLILHFCNFLQTLIMLRDILLIIAPLYLPCSASPNQQMHPCSSGAHLPDGGPSCPLQLVHQLRPVPHECQVRGRMWLPFGLSPAPPPQPYIFERELSLRTACDVGVVHQKHFAGLCVLEATSAFLFT